MKEKYERLVYCVPEGEVSTGMVERVSKRFPCLDVRCADRNTLREALQFSRALFFWLGGDIGDVTDLGIKDVALHYGKMFDGSGSYGVLFFEVESVQSMTEFRKLSEQVSEYPGMTMISPVEFVSYQQKAWNFVSERAGLRIPEQRFFIQESARVYPVFHKKEWEDAESGLLRAYFDYVVHQVKNIQEQSLTHALGSLSRIGQQYLGVFPEDDSFFRRGKLERMMDAEFKKKQFRR